MSVCKSFSGRLRLNPKVYKTEGKRPCVHYYIEDEFEDRIVSYRICCFDDENSFALKKGDLAYFCDFRQNYKNRNEYFAKVAGPYVYALLSLGGGDLEKGREVLDFVIDNMRKDKSA